MTIIADLIFMAIESWFNQYKLEGEDNVLSFSCEEDVDEFLDKINYNFNELRQFDNFKGGFCVADDNRITATIIVYLLDEDGLATCTKNFEITY